MNTSSRLPPAGRRNDSPMQSWSPRPSPPPMKSARSYPLPMRPAGPDLLQDANNAFRDVWLRNYVLRSQTVAGFAMPESIVHGTSGQGWEYVIIKKGHRPAQFPGEPPRFRDGRTARQSTPAWAALRHPRADPRGMATPRFWHRLIGFRHVISGSLALASLNHTCRNLVPTFPQRSPPSLLTTAACGGLRSTPDCRTRRAFLHLSYSYASPGGLALLVTQCHKRILDMGTVGGGPAARAHQRSS